MVWPYGGFTPEDMADMITTRSERGMTTTVNDIEHMESQSYAGISVIRMYFHPGAKIEAAIAQISAQANHWSDIFPRARARPDILRYNAAAVPILQFGLSSDNHERTGDYDLGSNFIRTQLATIQGASGSASLWRQAAHDHGGPQSAGAVSRGLSATDISSALNTESMILPTGSAKIGSREYRVEMNNTPDMVEAVQPAFRSNP